MKNILHFLIFFGIINIVSHIKNNKALDLLCSGRKVRVTVTYIQDLVFYDEDTERQVFDGDFDNGKFVTISELFGGIKDQIRYNERRQNNEKSNYYRQRRK